MRFSLAVISSLILMSCKVTEPMIAGTWISQTYHSADTITFAKDKTVFIKLTLNKPDNSIPVKDTFISGAGNWQLHSRHITIAFNDSIKTFFGNCGGLDIWWKRFKPVIVRAANCNEISNRFVIFYKARNF